MYRRDFIPQRIPGIVVWERREIKEPVVRWWEVVEEGSTEEEESGSTVRIE
jgi:hypothetical protein